MKVSGGCFAVNHSTRYGLTYPRGGALREAHMEAAGAACGRDLACARCGSIARGLTFPCAPASRRPRRTGRNCPTLSLTHTDGCVCARARRVCVTACVCAPSGPPSSFAVVMPDDAARHIASFDGKTEDGAQVCSSCAACSQSARPRTRTCGREGRLGGASLHLQPREVKFLQSMPPAA